MKVCTAAFSFLFPSRTERNAMLFGRRKANKKQMTPDNLESIAAEQETAATEPAAGTDTTISAAEADSTDNGAETEATDADESTEPSECDVLRDRLLRLQADFDNYRKRMLRERQDIILRANEDLLEALLTPLDHMDRAIDVMNSSVKEDDPCLQGIRLVRTEMKSALERFGLKPVAALGETFDPEQHEALGMMPATDDIAEGQVAVEVRAGYTLNGRLLRAAQVMVASAPAEPNAAETGE